MHGDTATRYGRPDPGPSPRTSGQPHPKRPGNHPGRPPSQIYVHFLMSLCPVRNSVAPYVSCQSRTYCTQTPHPGSAEAKVRQNQGRGAAAILSGAHLAGRAGGAGRGAAPGPRPARASRARGRLAHSRSHGQQERTSTAGATGEPGARRGRGSGGLACALRGGDRGRDSTAGGAGTVRRKDSQHGSPGGRPRGAPSEAPLRAGGAEPVRPAAAAAARPSSVHSVSSRRESGARAAWTRPSRFPGLSRAVSFFLSVSPRLDSCGCRPGAAIATVVKLAVRSGDPRRTAADPAPAAPPRRRSPPPASRLRPRGAVTHPAPPGRFLSRAPRAAGRAKGLSLTPGRENFVCCCTAEFPGD